MNSEERKREDKFLQFIGAAMDELIQQGTGQKLAFTVIIWELAEPDSTRFVSNAEPDSQIKALRQLNMALENGQGTFYKPGEGEGKKPQDPSMN